MLKKSFFITIFVLSAFLNGFTQNIDTIFLWPSAVPGESELADKQPNENQGDLTRISAIVNPLMVKFPSSKQNKKDMAIIVAPGGGYNILAINKEGYEIAEALNNMQIAAYVLQYRVPKKEEQALMDMQRAIRLVKAEGYKKVGVLGFSAGGSLSARAATRFNEVVYPKVDETDEASAKPDFAILIYPAYLDRGPENTLTPELTITEHTPPFFIFGTADDKHGNSSLVMAKALRDKGIPIDLHLMSVGGHGYGLRPGNPAAVAWPKLLHEWLKTFK